MGLLDFIFGKVERFNDEAQNAYMDAINKDAKDLCDAVQHVVGIARMSGYNKALQEKASAMKDSDLKKLFNYAYKNRYAKAVSAMASVMENRGLVYRDSDGVIQKLY